MKMKSKLIFIGGEAWTGKSTCADILYKHLNNSAWLDGDSITLMSDENTLRERAKARDKNQNPTFAILEQTKQIENTIRINTANRTPEEVIDELYKVICASKK